MTPEEFRTKVLKNPWFLWVLIILGVNPLYFVKPAFEGGAQHLEEVANHAF